MKMSTFAFLATAMIWCSSGLAQQPDKLTEGLGLVLQGKYEEVFEIADTLEPAQRDILLVNAWNIAVSEQDCDAMQAVYDEMKNEVHKGIFSTNLEMICS